MEIKALGRVKTTATIENMKDLWEVESGMRPADQARQVAIQDALVDSGTTVRSLPVGIIGELGLRKTSSKRATSSHGEVTEAGLYEAVRLTIQGRTCTIDVLEVPDNVPTLIGQVPLVLLDFVVDPRGGKLVGNPAHGGEHIFEMYWETGLFRTRKINRRASQQFRRLFGQQGGRAPRGFRACKWKPGPVPHLHYLSSVECG